MAGSLTQGRALEADGRKGCADLEAKGEGTTANAPSAGSPNGKKPLVSSVRANAAFAALNVRLVVDGAWDGNDFELAAMALSGASFEFQSQPAGTMELSGRLSRATVQVPEADGARSVLFENVNDQTNGAPVVAFTYATLAKSKSPLSDEPEAVANVEIGDCRVVYVGPITTHLHTASTNNTNNTTTIITTSIITINAISLTPPPGTCSSKSWRLSNTSTPASWARSRPR